MTGQGEEEEREKLDEIFDRVFLCLSGSSSFEFLLVFFFMKEDGQVYVYIYIVVKK